MFASNKGVHACVCGRGWLWVRWGVGVSYLPVYDSIKSDRKEGRKEGRSGKLERLCLKRAYRTAQLLPPGRSVY